MTTKRKQILKALAFASCTTMDDLVMTTGLERKNLADNVKATIKEGLCERFRDDVTGQPAYKLTPKGRAWLENDKDDGKQPQPVVGKNAGSKDAGPIVDSGVVAADPLPVGDVVGAPPKPDKTPVAAGADVNAIQKEMDQEVRLTMAGKTIIDFCEWLAGKAKVRCPMNLYECKAIVSDLMQASGANADLEAMALAQAMTIKDLQSELEGRDELIADQSIRIALLESNAELPLDAPQPVRYITAENYIISHSETEARQHAFDIAKEIEIDTPVLVFASHNARELRINWRDA